MKIIIFVMSIMLFVCGCEPFANAEAIIAPVKTCAVTLPRIENYNPFSGPTSGTKRTTITGPSNPEPAAGK